MICSPESIDFKTIASNGRHCLWSGKQPKALCELQGYVFDAKMRMVESAGTCTTLRSPPFTLDSTRTPFFASNTRGERPVPENHGRLK